MYHLQKAFENSLRCPEPSPKAPRKNIALQHRSCKGTAHACGNYTKNINNCNDDPLINTLKVNNVNVDTTNKNSQENGQNVTNKLEDLNNKHNNKFKRKNSKTSSISSEGHSETDSLDSLTDNNKKPNGILQGVSSDSTPKNANVSVVDRLHSTATKASIAKTAKMRYLELDDEEDACWIQDLRKEANKNDKNETDKEKKQKRRNKLKNILNNMNNSCSDNSKTNGVVTHADTDICNESTVKNGDINQLNNVRKNNFKAVLSHNNANNVKPPWNANRISVNRASFRRRSIRRNFNNVKAVTWEEAVSLSEKRKFSVVNDDKNNFLKDWQELLAQKYDSGVDETDKAKSEEQVAIEKQWLDAEKVWLVHRGGFAAARKDSSIIPDNGKIRIRLEHTGDILDVDEDDIEKANPPQFDRAEDLSTLRNLNESSLLHTLRQRYATNLIHTYAGNSTLLVVNPMAPLAIYSEKVIALFKGCKSEDMPPHIYSIAQSAYHNMLSSRRDQSIAFLGRSASGKTTNFRHSIQYLVTAAGTVNKILTVEKLTAIWNVLESFGNCKTVMNTNATRFTQIFSLDFDQSGVIASASIQILMLEKSRIAKKVDLESTFHIMYRMLAGVEGNLRKELFLENISGNEQNAFITLLQKHEDKQRAQTEFIKVCSAFGILGISEQEQKAIWSVLAAIFHLGCAGATKGNTNNRYQFVNPQSAQRAAHLLGTTVEEISRVIFGSASGGLATPNAPRAPFRTPSPTEKGLDRDVVGLEALEGMIVGLYAEVFNCVASLINRSISASTHTVTSLLLVDTPGFQNAASCGKQTGASFEDLCHNYVQERLQLLYYHSNLVAPRDRYIQENIELSCDENDSENLINPLPLINLLDKTAQNSVVRTSQTDLHDCDRRGLLWLLDEEAIYPGSSDDTFLERLFTHFGDRDHQLLLRKAPGNNQFILQHLQGTNPVLYACSGWLKYSRENPISRAAVTILQESCKEDISKLFVGARGLGASSFSGSVVGIEGSQSLRRASSIRRTFTAGTAAIKRKSICLQTKFTVDGLIETLRRTKLRFVHCLLPQHGAGHCETTTALLAVKSVSNQAEDAVVNVPLMRSQIRGGQILEAVRLYKQGFPHFLPLSEFRRRFQLLAADFKPKSPIIDERKTVEDMILCLDLDFSSYRVGLSQEAQLLMREIL